MLTGLTPLPPDKGGSQFTDKGLEKPVPITTKPIELMTEEEVREELRITRERLVQFEVVLANFYDQFKRNLGYMFSLPAIPQVRVLLGRKDNE